MKIIFITEGASEYKSLPKLFDQFSSRSGNVLIPPLLVNVAPDSHPRIVAKECETRIRIAIQKKADLAVILLDREQQENCPGEIASKIELQISNELKSKIDVKVVIKDSCYENWLISDLVALKLQPKRFNISKGTENKVSPNKADKCDAQALLSSATGRSYQKVDDSLRICSKFDVARAALNSRSFRHLLHVIGDRSYHSQCRNP